MKQEKFEFKLLTNFERAQIRAALAVLNIDASSLAHKYGVAPMSLSRLLGTAKSGTFDERNAPGLVEYLRTLIPKSEMTLRSLESKAEEVIVTIDPSRVELFSE